MKRISRRNFLKVAGVGAAALGLAACGGSSSSTASSAASSAATSSAVAADVTIKVAAIETGYGAEMWKKVTEAFTACIFFSRIYYYYMGTNDTSYQRTFTNW